jgi:beta-glucosidase
MTMLKRLLAHRALAFLAAIFLGHAASEAAVDEAPPAIRAKVDALLSDMSLDEKIGQMTQVDSNALKDKSAIQKHCLGSVLSGGGSDPPDNSPQSWAALVAECEDYSQKTRLKIPLLYGIDAVHGHNNIDGATIFPHNIGLGATRNPKLVEQAARATAEEVAATRINWVFAPCIAVARNPRWGRTYESFGETPELAESLGAAAVRGFQGKTLADRASVLACAKHFLGDGGTTDGKDQGNTVCDEATLRRLFLPGYQATVKAGVGSIMVSFNSINGQKMHGNKHLLTDVLKGELGFDGFLISDWAAIDQLGADYKKDIESAINAGLDMIMIPYGPGQKNNYVDFINGLKELVADGKVPESRIDDAVRRILTAKARLGLFEHQKSDPLEVIGSPEHRAIARDCVRQSLVLLKNQNKALPLSKESKHLAVVGKAADDLGMQCGGWTIDWQGKPGAVTKGGTTILEALRHALPAADIKYSPDGQGIDLSNAEALITVIGELPYAEMKGDRNDLKLSKEDLALVDTAKKSGKPTITLLISGRPLIFDSALEKSDALVALWLPGTEGAGVADVLIGDYKPTGKLPVTWPRSMSQIPIHGDDTGKEPLFPYGFGLSY